MPRVAPMIFVSSTKEDLAEYRAAIQRSFPALDVLYRGMEFFGARPSRTFDVITEELVSCDLYIGILAHRYGSRDPVSGVSFTELEYQIAKREGIPTMFFLIDQPPPERSNETDREGKKRLASFKETARSETVCEMFTTPEDLAAKVGQSLTRWLAQMEHEWQQLRHVPLDDRENDYIRKLYSSNSQEISYAITRLVRVDCREAHENFYGLLQRDDTPMDVAEKLFQQLRFSQDEKRVSQMLLNTIADRPRLRALAVDTIGERAIINDRQVTDSEIDRVISLLTENDADVRFAVAHALSRIAVRRPARLKECRAHLETLKNDPDERVRARAQLSITRLPQRGP